MRKRRLILDTRIVTKLETVQVFWNSKLIEGYCDEDGIYNKEYLCPKRVAMVRDPLSDQEFYRLVFGTLPNEVLRQPHWLYPVTEANPLPFDEARLQKLINLDGLTEEDKVQIRQLYEEMYAQDSEFRKQRDKTLRDNPLPFVEADGSEWKYYPVALSTVGQAMVPHDWNQREITIRKKTRRLWGPQEWTEFRDMTDVGEQSPPIGSVSPATIDDISYNPRADLFILVLGTDKIGACDVQVKEAMSEAEGEEIEVWPFPMETPTAYQGAMERITALIRRGDDPRPEGYRGHLDSQCRGPFVFRKDVGPVKPDGYYMLKDMGFQSKPDPSMISRTEELLHSLAPMSSDVDRNMEYITDNLRRAGLGLEMKSDKSYLGDAVPNLLDGNFEVINHGSFVLPRSNASSAGSESWARASQCTSEWDGEGGEGSTTRAARPEHFPPPWWSDMNDGGGSTQWMA